MAVLTGVVGTLKLDNAEIDVTNWTLNIANNKSETTPLGVKDSTFTQTTRGATGSFTVAAETKTCVAVVDGVLNDQLAANSLGAVWLQLYHDESGVDEWSFSAVIDGIAINNNPSDVLFESFTFTKTGTFFAVPST